jgi:MoxR-like ATPase
MTTETNPNWYIYQGTNQPHDNIKNLPKPPAWRNFSEKKQKGENDRGSCYIPNPQDIELVNAALYLRRPLLVEGKAGVGKTSLAYSVAYELGLGSVLRWSITTRTTLKDALYQYDAIGRLQDSSLKNRNNETTSSRIKYPNYRQNKHNSLPEINEYLRLGALGTAFANESDKPRVLLIDEIDKSDIDLPNDLLHIFEEGAFEIPELVRLKGEHFIRPSDNGEAILIKDGKVHCKQFPLVIMTSNGEREFPPAFLRRCLQLEMQLPDKNKLEKIVESHLSFNEKDREKVNTLIEEFLNKRDGQKADLATDQLLNAVHLTLNNIELDRDKDHLLESLWKSLSIV